MIPGFNRGFRKLLLLPLADCWPMFRPPRHLFASRVG